MAISANLIEMYGMRRGLCFDQFSITEMIEKEPKSLPPIRDGTSLLYQ